MKKIFLSLLILTLSLTSYSQQVYTENDARVISDLKACCNCDVYIPTGGINALKKQLKECKDKKIKQIAIPAVGITLILLIVFLLINNEKNKKDPIKNLDNLRKKNIITKKEFDDKVNESKIISEQERITKIKKKETDKLITDLKNLRAKGILSEVEYREKLAEIIERTA